MLGYSDNITGLTEQWAGRSNVFWTLLVDFVGKERSLFEITISFESTNTYIGRVRKKQALK